MRIAPLLYLNACATVCVSDTQFQKLLQLPVEGVACSRIICLFAVSQHVLQVEQRPDWFVTELL